MEKGVQAVVDQNHVFLEGIIEEYGRDPAALIAMLQVIQEQYRYLPEDHLLYLAEAIGVTAARVYGVATFYDYFSLVPKGKYLIKVCDGTACHVRNSREIIETVRRDLSLSPHEESTSDLLFTLETVSCLGACGLAPVMLINDKVHRKVTPAGVREIIDEIRLREDGCVAD